MYKPRQHSDLGELSADTATLSGPESSDTGTANGSRKRTQRQP